jgi:hypothetical protein
MIPKEFGSGVRIILLVAGLVILLNRSIPLLDSFALILGLACIQIAQKGHKTQLGWIGVVLSVMTPLLATFWHPNLTLGQSSMSIVTGPVLVSFIVAIPLIVGVVLVGISMRNSGFFSRRSGELFALSPVLGLVLGLPPVLALAFVLLGVFYPKGPIDGTDAKEDTPSSRA